MVNTERINSSSLPLGKWLLEFFVGLFIFFVLYGLVQGCVFTIQPLGLRVALLLLSSWAVLALFSVWIRLFEDGGAKPILFCKVACNFTKGVAIGSLFISFIAGALAIIGDYQAEYASPYWDYIVVNLFVCLFVACSEEILFRGIIFKMIDERFGLWWALGISAMLFGIVHFINPGATIWSTIAIATEAGVLLGAVYKYSSSLWFPIGVHFSWNFFEGNIYGFSVSGGGEEESVLISTLNGSDILTGGTFGPETSIITLALGILLSVFFLNRI